MPGATVEQVLRAVLVPLRYGDPDVPGQITYRVKDGMLRLIRRGPAEPPGMANQGDVITLHIEEKPLAEVLRELAGRTGANIVLDVHEKEKAKTAVSGSFSDVRLMPALRVLADTCDLHPVAVNNIFYVTSKENAKRLEEEFLHPRRADSPPGPAAPIPKPKDKPDPMK